MQTYIHKVCHVATWPIAAAKKAGIVATFPQFCQYQKVAAEWEVIIVNPVTSFQRSEIFESLPETVSVNVRHHHHAHDCCVYI